jgi:uncharacterized protein (TIGR03435 family)
MRLLIVALASVVFCQERPQFDVASIKLHPGIGNLVHIQPLPGGREMAGVTMAELASALSRGELHRRIVDKTGLTGTFGVHVTWTFDAASSANPGTAAGPAIFTALQEQLGLKLESAKGPVEILVIDHIERPSAN